MLFFSVFFSPIGSKHHGASKWTKEQLVPTEEPICCSPIQRVNVEESSPAQIKSLWSSYSGYQLNRLMLIGPADWILCNQMGDHPIILKLSLMRIMARFLFFFDVGVFHSSLCNIKMCNFEVLFFKHLSIVAGGAGVYPSYLGGVHPGQTSTLTATDILE